jgi:enamine deaminase RidA (YjgF/YER057c/UK114 family)
MATKKQVFGGPYMSRGRVLSVSKAVRAGDFIFLTGVVPRVGDEPMTTGSIEDQTRVVCETIKATLSSSRPVDRAQTSMLGRHRLGCSGCGRAALHIMPSR